MYKNMIANHIDTGYTILLRLIMIQCNKYFMVIRLPDIIFICSLSNHQMLLIVEMILIFGAMPFE